MKASAVISVNEFQVISILYSPEINEVFIVLILVWKMIKVNFLFSDLCLEGNAVEYAEGRCFQDEARRLW